MAVPEVVFVGNAGGTSMRFGIGTEHGLLHNQKIETPTDPDKFFWAIGEAALRYMHCRPDITTGAVGFPGPVRIKPDGIAVGPFVNIPGLGTEPFDIGERVAAEHRQLSGFRWLPLNDAEAETHAAPSVIEEDTTDQTVLYFGIGTGVGGDAIRNGVIISRAAGILGENGHIPLQRDDGTYTTLEALASGTAIRDLYGNGEESAEELAKYASAQSSWNRVGNDLARGIAVLAPVIGMSHVVIGGGVSRDHSRYERALYSELARAVAPIPDHIVGRPPAIHFVPPDRVDTLGLEGALLAAQRRHEEF